jgi:hypothetical protein
VYIARHQTVDYRVAFLYASIGPTQKRQPVTRLHVFLETLMHGQDTNRVLPVRFEVSTAVTMMIIILFYLLVNEYKQRWEAMQSSWTIRHVSMKRISIVSRNVCASIVRN